MNVLFLVADDMRPELNSYLGSDFPSPVHPKIHSPNLDKLASKSLVLRRAYVQQAWCSPSRTSLLTGRRPDTTHVYDLKTYFRESGGNFTTLPQYFKEHGYLSIGMGKIFHPGVASHGDDPISWSKPYWHAPNWKLYNEHKHSWWAVSEKVRAKKELPDIQISERAIKTIRKIADGAKSGQQPFFLAVGFHKPHLPFVFPKEYLSFYPKENIRLPDNPYAPVNMPKVAWKVYDELMSYRDIHRSNATGKINSTLANEVVIDLRRAYYSALTYTDRLIGDVLDELEAQGLSNNTIVSFWGDHGWQLGEHGEWCKQTNFELATHAPMMVHVPGVTDEGILTEQLTEFVDLYPTLVDAAGLPPVKLCPKDSRNIKVCTEGMSLMPLMTRDSVKWKNRVFSQFPRSPEGQDVMGYTMKTNQYRYTEWVRFSGKPEYKPEWSKVYGVELYDHKKDPEENRNHADDPKYNSIRKHLSEQLHAGWRAAYTLA